MKSPSRSLPLRGRLHHLCLASPEPERLAGVWPHTERTLNSWGRAPLRS